MTGRAFPSPMNQLDRIGLDWCNVFFRTQSMSSVFSRAMDNDFFGMDASDRLKMKSLLGTSHGSTFQIEKNCDIATVVIIVRNRSTDDRLTVWENTHQNDGKNLWNLVEYGDEVVDSYRPRNTYKRSGNTSAIRSFAWYISAFRGIGWSRDEENRENQRCWKQILFKLKSSMPTTCDVQNKPTNETCQRNEKRISGRKY